MEEKEWQGVEKERGENGGGGKRRERPYILIVLVFFVLISYVFCFFFLLASKLELPRPFRHCVCFSKQNTRQNFSQLILLASIVAWKRCVSQSWCVACCAISFHVAPHLPVNFPFPFPFRDIFRIFFVLLAGVAKEQLFDGCRSDKLQNFLSTGAHR